MATANDVLSHLKRERERLDGLTAFAEAAVKYGTIDGAMKEAEARLNEIRAEEGAEQAILESRLAKSAALEEEAKQRLALLTEEAAAAERRSKAAVANAVADARKAIEAARTTEVNVIAAAEAKAEAIIDSANTFMQKARKDLADLARQMDEKKAAIAEAEAERARIEAEIDAIFEARKR